MGFVPLLDSHRRLTRKQDTALVFFDVTLVNASNKQRLVKLSNIPSQVYGLPHRQRDC